MPAGDTEERPGVAVIAAAQIAAVALHQDKSAFAALFKHFAPRVKSYLKHAGFPDDIAEDLAQETMFRVWRRARYFDAHRGTALTWIYSIARNLRVDKLRHQRYATDVRLVDIEIAPPTPEYIIGVLQSDRQLHEALLAISPKLHKVVVRSFFGECSHGEVARQLDLPIGTVKTRIRIALGKLRRAVIGSDSSDSHLQQTP